MTTGQKTVMPQLVDSQARLRAQEALDRSIALSAGAGAGKTSVLVGRLTGLLLGGTDPSRIAAITFTEKATQGLVRRVRDDLERKAQEASGQERQHVLGLLSRFPELTISTIHAFCRKLLAWEALEAGWAPGTEILAESVAPSTVEGAYRRWRKGLWERHRELAVRVEREVSAHTLHKGAMALLENRDLTAVTGASSPAWAEAHARILAIRQGLHAAANQCKSYDTLIRGNANGLLLDLLDKAVALTDPRETVLLALASQSEGNINKSGRKDQWAGGSKADFVDALKAYKAWRKELASLRGAELHQALTEDLLEHFLPLVERAKVQASQADFQDLLLRALFLLRDIPLARGRLAERFDALLVDEVQDTDPIQSEIVLLLTRDPGDQGGWQDHPPRPGRLFAVGDPKQSIYRFRRADVHQWRELTDLITRQGEGLSLTQNFRSVPGLVAFINEAFAGLPGYEPQVAHRPAGELDPVVVVEGEDTDALVRYLHHLKASDRGKALRWRDVMILLPSWSKAEEVQDGLLLAGVPCLVEGGRTFFGRDEIRLAMAVLGAMDEPGDYEAIVFVLRGLFGLSLERLVQHVAQGGGWRYTVPEMPPGPVADALAILRELHRRRHGQSWVTLLDALLERTHASAVWSLLGRGPAILANLDKLRGIIRQLEPLTSSPGEVVRRLEELSRGKEDDLSCVDEDTDAVTITTIFKAKGLEAPVVVLAHSHRKADTPVRLINRSRGEVAVSMGKDIVPPQWAEWEKEGKDEAAMERRRWMYVAATRAREQLVLIQGDKHELFTPDLAGLLPQGGEHGDLAEPAPGVTVRFWRADSLAEPPWEACTFPGLDETVDRLLEGPGAWEDLTVAGRAKGKADLARAQRACERRVTVTELARREVRGHGGDRALAVAGRVVHRVMEHLDLSRPVVELEPLVSPLVEAFAGLEGLPLDLLNHCHAVVLRLLAHEAVELARAAPETYKEVPFAFPEGNRVVTGVIDLCFPLDGSRQRWMVVDWKSDLPEEGSDRRGAYEKQLALYARALIKNMTGLEAEDVETRLVGPHRELALSAEDAIAEVVAEAREGLREELAGLLARGAPLPTVGGDIGEPVIASGVELVWEEMRLALALDRSDEEALALREAGWEVVVESTDRAGWAQRGIERVEAARDLWMAAQSSKGKPNGL